MRLFTQGKNPVHLRRGIAVALLMTGLAACSSSDTHNSQVVQQSACPGNPSNDGLVARVNCEGITRAEYERELARRMKGDTVTDLAALRQDVLDGLIEQRLVARAAAGMGITVTDAEAAAEVQRLKAMLTSPADWQAYLDANGYTEAEMQQAQKNVLLSQRVQTVLFAGLNGNVRQVHARHIVVRTEAEANEVLNRLKNGEDFVTLAATFSIDLTTRERGGDLGWFVASELIDKRLGEVAFSLNPGSIAGPIASTIGYHIIQTIEFAERPIEPRRLTLLSQHIYENWLAEQFQKTHIERYLS